MDGCLLSFLCSGMCESSETDRDKAEKTEVNSEDLAAFVTNHFPEKFGL